MAGWLQLQMVTAVHHHQQGSYSCQRTGRCYVLQTPDKALYCLCLGCTEKAFSSHPPYKLLPTSCGEVNKNALTCKPPPNLAQKAISAKQEEAASFRRTDRKKRERDWRCCCCTAPPLCSPISSANLLRKGGRMNNAWSVIRAGVNGTK